MTNRSVRGTRQRGTQHTGLQYKLVWLLCVCLRSPSWLLGLFSWTSTDRSIPTTQSLPPPGTGPGPALQVKIRVASYPRTLIVAALTGESLLRLSLTRLRRSKIHLDSQDSRIKHVKVSDAKFRVLKMTLVRDGGLLLANRFWNWDDVNTLRLHINENWDVILIGLRRGTWPNVNRHFFLSSSVLTREKNLLFQIDYLFDISKIVSQLLVEKKNL